MDEVVYILGAGFSAPLGLPVMSNFLSKSKDLYFAQPEQYGYFRKVLDRIKVMAVAKNYYTADLFNIEEILSIIEMDSFVGGEQFRNEFLQYIRDVIAFYTPQITPYNHLPSNWEGFVFGGDRLWRGYGYFVANLCNVMFSRMSDLNVVCKANPNIKARYSVISLNYDLVLESICSFVTRTYKTETQMGFCTAQDVNDGPILAKLHGSIDGDTIVPPTWSKGAHPGIVPAWKSALNVLRKANQIRFVGYSLPSADAYVRYLLKSAAMEAEHLKRIDVICLDPDGTARRQYNDFVTFRNFRFADADTRLYLGALSQKTTSRSPEDNWWRKLENSHEEFMAAGGV